MSLREVKSPLAPKMTIEHGSITLRPVSKRQTNNSSNGSGCSMASEGDGVAAGDQPFFRTAGANDDECNQLTQSAKTQKRKEPEFSLRLRVKLARFDLRFFWRLITW